MKHGFLTLTEKLDQLDLSATEMTEQLSTPGNCHRLREIPEARQAAFRPSANRREAPRVQANEKDRRCAMEMVLEAEDAEMKHMAQEEENSSSTQRKR
jgi:protein subunit release factor A